MQRPADATHYLDFRGGRKLVVHAAQRAFLCGEGIVDLQEAGHQTVLRELVFAEEAREKTAVVAALLEVDEMGAGERQGFEFHLGITSLSTTVWWTCRACWGAKPPLGLPAQIFTAGALR